MPATKLLKVTPTGSQSTGEYEWKDYAQALLDIRNNVYTPFLERHYELLVRSSYPDLKDIKLSVKFNPIEVPTSVEIATQESRIAQLLNTLIRAGVIAPEEARTVLRGEENGMFKGISASMPESLKRPQGGNFNSVFGKVEGKFLDACMEAELAAIPHLDAIYLLKGWERSEGARRDFLSP